MVAQMNPDLSGAQAGHSLVFTVRLGKGHMSKNLLMKNKDTA